MIVVASSVVKKETTMISTFDRSLATRKTEPGFFLRLVELVELWAERRRGRIALQTMSDELLKDIGVNRLQAQAEADKWFWRT
jgi:uncharacterized protein YjiS (DUF1127 family)